MEQLWAPWRIEYILMEKPTGCFLCQKPSVKTDEDNFIILRGKTNFVTMNAFPYNPGHLLVAPYRHTAILETLSSDELLEHFELVRSMVLLLKEAMRPDGFNIGLNLGKVAGAGVEDHIHTHIVPRWLGDTNYMPVIAETRVVPEGIAATYSKLKERLNQHQ